MPKKPPPRPAPETENMDTFGPDNALDGMPDDPLYTFKMVDGKAVRCWSGEVMRGGSLVKIGEVGDPLPARLRR